MSNIKFDKWLNPNGTENYKCRAWVNFDGDTTPPTIRGSGNVSSVSRTATGDFTVNFTVAMPDANYVTVATANQLLARTPINSTNTTDVRVITGRPADFNGNMTFVNAINANVSIFR